MRRALATLFLTSLAVLATAQNLTVTPTTTYATETGNNTSSAPTFTTQPNGNIGGANISKVDTRTLIYPGFSGQIYAHVETWWGSGSHISIGYNSQDPAQVQRQITDMLSRGMDGAVVDWYGPGSYEDGPDKTFFSQAELHPGFSAIVEIDVGAIKWHSCYPTCSATTAAVNLFTTMGNTFFASPAYARTGGRPIAMEFGMETLTLPSGMPTGWNVVDWSAVQTQVPGNIALFHRNLTGFSKASSAGAFSWMEPKTLDKEPAGYDGTDELIWMYGQSASTKAAKTFGAVWKGFNDILASWAPAGGRHIEQNCGQTWLNTFTVLNQYYSSSNQIAAVQLVTWNDYEEGSEIESGIDNCVSVNASMSGSKLNWTVSGSESTIDHYTVFISTDGQNLMALGDFVAGVHSVDVASYSPAAGTYSLYVKAIGKPSLTNKMSNATTLTVAAPNVSSSLTVTPTSGNAPLAVTATASSTTSSTTSGALLMATTNSTNIDFGDGTIVSGSSATHTYIIPGTYTVTANVVNSSGVTSTSTSTVKAMALAPTAALSLSATTGVVPATISASTAASTDPNAGGTISGSTVDWGDGTVSAGPTATHVYSMVGTFTVTATVIDNYGASSTKTQSVSITGNGVTISSPLTGSTQLSPVHVVASAVSGNGVASMITYLDDVKMYTTYTAQTDISLPMTPGSHRIVVNSWDTKGALMQAATTITVNAQAPTATLSLSATSALTGTSITASTAASTDPNVSGSITSSTIAWGDGTSSAGPSAAHAYAAAGSYAVTATVTDNYGKSATATKTVSIAAPVNPIAALTLSATSGTAPVSITASTAGSTDPNAGGSIVSSTINWGDGTSSAGPSASHTYSTAGTFTVTATVFDNYGKSASTAKLVTVTASAAVAPTAAMTITMSGATATVSTAASTAGSGSITSTVINWGDGTSSTGVTASHTYVKGGYFTITATVKNSYGLSSSTSQQVTAAGVMIWLPQPGTTAAQPVHIAATAYDSKKIATVIVYMDGNEIYRTTATDFDKWFSMRNGTHRLVVKAWEDVTGVVYQSTVTFSAK
jgi:PKD repeat protein